MKNKTKRIAITGLTGVIGKVLLSELPDKIEVIDLFHNTSTNSPKVTENKRLNLLETKSIIPTLEKTKPDYIIHMAAITHIDTCEKDKPRGKGGVVWKTNVDSTTEIAKFCEKHNIPLMYLSTECVFDGKEEMYDEDAKKHPINWYGVTKSAAEDCILASHAPAAIIRSVVAYHKADDNKTLYGKILQNLQKNKIISAVDDQRFTPTHTYDIVHAMIQVIERKLTGIYHVVPQKILSPYDMALLVAKANKYPESQVKRASLQSFYSPERAALRLRNACLLARKSNSIIGLSPASPEDVL